MSFEQRKITLIKTQAAQYDLIIVGGGITGAGIALDATDRGLRVLLLEKGDFASGTSGSSTKLIHGGLRYLKQGKLKLVSQVGRERAVVHQLARNLVIPEVVLLPIIGNAFIKKIILGFGLMLYDVLAGVVRKDRRRIISKEELYDQEPVVREIGLSGAIAYTEYRTDDARLTLAVLKTAVKLGASILNYTEMNTFKYDKSGSICGVVFEDLLQDKLYEVSCRAVINATGPWVDQVCKIDKKGHVDKILHSKGVHIVVGNDKLPIKNSMYINSSDDGRMIFLIPRGNCTYIGTTETLYIEPLEHLNGNEDDVTYLIEKVNNFFKKLMLTRSDVHSWWCGVRPLINQNGKKPSEISRKEELFRSDSGLYSIAGGKLTGYRKMARKVVNEVLKNEWQTQRACNTASIRLSGCEFTSDQELLNYKETLKQKLAAYNIGYRVNYLVSNYGRYSDDIIDLLGTFSDEDMELRLIRCELKFSVENEFTYHLIDFISRRTGRLFFEIGNLAQFINVLASDMQECLIWSDEEKVDQQNRAQAAINAFKLKTN